VALAVGGARGVVAGAEAEAGTEAEAGVEAEAGAEAWAGVEAEAVFGGRPRFSSSIRRISVSTPSSWVV
jgi:hypothetical protein